MIRLATAYGTTLVIFLGIDAIWLTTMAQRLYRPYLNDVMAQNVNPVPAALFYIVYVAGIIVFATTPAFSTGRWTTAAIFGALYGFFAYATYDLTNLATLKVWSLKVSLIDIAWGAVLSGAAASTGALAGMFVNRG